MLLPQMRYLGWLGWWNGTLTIFHMSANAHWFYMSQQSDQQPTSAPPPINSVEFCRKLLVLQSITPQNIIVFLHAHSSCPGMMTLLWHKHHLSDMSYGVDSMPLADQSIFWALAVLPRMIYIKSCEVSPLMPTLIGAGCDAFKEGQLRSVSVDVLIVR